VQTLITGLFLSQYISSVGSLSSTLMPASLLAFLMPNRIDIAQAHRITVVALHLGVFQGIVNFHGEALCVRPGTMGLDT
jgi:hypothetical protein